MSTSRQFVAVIKSVTDCTNEGKNLNGIFTLNHDYKNYFLNWNPYNISSNPGLFNILNSRDNYKESGWTFPSNVNIDCQSVSVLKISENPTKFTIHRLDCDDCRSFTISDSSFDDFVNFIEKLILTGVAVPSSESEYCLFFNMNSRVGYFNTVSPELQLEFTNPKDIKGFWERVHQFFVDFMKFIQSHYSSPLKGYPLDVGARSCNAMFTKKVSAYFESSVGKYSAVKYNELQDLFDKETGRFKDYKSVKDRIYFAGLESKAIPVLLPFLVNLYPSDSTEAERVEIRKRLRKSFDDLCECVSLIQDYQVANNKKLSCSYRVIAHDVMRTDRHHPAFKEQSGQGLTLLTKILKAYNIYNQRVNYVQGMNDLFVPILDAFIPSWDEKGNPLDYDGKPLDVSQIDYLMFWCYANFLEVTNHTEFLPIVSEQCKNMSSHVMELLNDLAPTVAIWLENKGLVELIWCYTDYVLLFKRSFQHIWPIWINIISAPDPCEWITHFASSLIVSSFDELSKMPNVAITDILASFPVIIQSLNVTSISRSADYISSFYTKKFAQAPEEPDSYVPEFFHVPSEQN